MRLGYLSHVTHFEISSVITPRCSAIGANGNYDQAPKLVPRSFDPDREDAVAAQLEAIKIDTGETRALVMNMMTRMDAYFTSPYSKHTSKE